MVPKFGDSLIIFVLFSTAKTPIFKNFMFFRTSSEFRGEQVPYFSTGKYSKITVIEGITVSKTKNNGDLKVP